MGADRYREHLSLAAKPTEEEKIMPNAIALLRADHNDIQAMLAEIAETAERAVDTRQRLWAKISLALRTHVQIEEEMFYPALETSAKNPARPSWIHAGVEEFCSLVKLALPDLEQTELGSVEFTGWVNVLKELVARHTDEEQGLFATARELLSHDKLETLGQAMEARKQELLSAG